MHIRAVYNCIDIAKVLCSYFLVQQVPKIIIICEFYFGTTTVIVLLHVKNATIFTLVREGCKNYPI